MYKNKNKKNCSNFEFPPPYKVLQSKSRLHKFEYYHKIIDILDKKDEKLMILIYFPD